jgi:tetratricopeptide (TPR) repeat protein/predicted Ser/Thr protein kinase
MAGQEPTHDPAALFRLAADGDLDSTEDSAPGRSESGRAYVPLELGCYQILEQVGRGAMAKVYRAADASGRQVALKVVREGASPERLAREGQLAAQLDHPGILPVHAAGRDGEARFLVYPLIEGARTLEEVWEELPREEVLARLAEVADALAHAHAHGVVHRDVKPENVLIDREGRLLVADFGVGLAADVERLTRTGAIVGTPMYMALEQLMGQRDLHGPPADVWSLGVILHRLLDPDDGFPFPGPSLVALCGQMQTGPPPLAGAPRGLVALRDRALASEPDARPSAAAFAAALRAFLEGISDSNLRPVAVARRVGWTAAVALGALGVLLVVWLAVGGGDPVAKAVERPTTPPEQPVEAAPAPVQEPSAVALAALGRAADLEAAREWTSAESELRFALGQLDPRHPRTAEAREQLAELYRSWLDDDMLRTGAADERLAQALLELAPSLDPASRERVAQDALRWAKQLISVQKQERAAELLEVTRPLAGGRAEAVLARVLLDDLRLDEAQAVVDDMLARDLNDPRGVALQGELHLARGNWAAAEAWTARALELDPDLPAGRRVRAFLREQQGDLRGALADADVSLAAWEPDPWALKLRAILRRRLGDGEGAVADALVCFNMRPSVGRDELGHAYEAVGDWAKAGEAWEGVVAYDNASLEGRMRLAVCLRNQHRFEEALEEARVALDHHPDAPEPHLSRLITIDVQGATRQAKQELLEAVRRGPLQTHLPAYRFLVDRFHGWDAKWRSPRLGVWACDRALALSPGDSWFLQRRAVCHEALGDLDAAWVDVQAALASNPENPEALSLRGRLTIGRGDVEEGLADMGRAIELDRDNAYRWSERGMEYMGLERWEEANSDYAQFVRWIDDNQVVWWRYGYCLGQAGRFAEAEEAFARAAHFYTERQGSPRWQVYYHRGLTRMKAGDLAGAREDLEQALVAQGVDGPRRVQTRAALADLERLER